MHCNILSQTSNLHVFYKCSTESMFFMYPGERALGNKSCNETKSVFLDGYATLYRRPYVLVWNTKFVRGTSTTGTSDASADATGNLPIQDRPSRRALGRRQRQPRSPEVARMGSLRPEMVFKASGGDTGDHAAPQRALPTRGRPLLSLSNFELFVFCPTLRIPNILRITTILITY
eukprot:SAG11_NODE_3378_length_2488_cov_11.156969_1_plen_175_part_00